MEGKLSEDVQEALNFALEAVATARPANPVTFVAEKLLEFNRAKKEEESKIDQQEKAKIAARRGGTRRRQNVFSETVSVDDDWTPPNIAKSSSDRERILGIVSKNLLFGSLEDDDLNVIVNAMFAMNFKEGDVIIKEGKRAEGGSRQRGRADTLWQPTCELAKY